MNRIAAVFCLLPFAAAIASAADLTVVVKDVRSSTGSVFIAVYDRDTSFMKPPLAKLARKANAAPGEIKFVVHDLPPGTYAVSSYHDENSNGKLDTNSLGVPTEGYGFSNDAQGAGGPPKFAQAAFDFDGKSAKTIEFSLNY
ncbi:MAG TPA: DUF2141 domain-containing protein [Bryobacteraceae bacterium]|nr:DUF2141 domain-containing protein [Bryobacteraceae bacterium]